ncbi:homeodomain transcription factor ste12 [Rhizopus stolonifer]|uniref:Homeodomain transcription factor ste12 n=2 Tax=Mucorineae TaxID=1344963 RepID=A0A367KIK4_RHIST|nr:homeodomain transcription factor ste12 [Rhizopus stolonifer]
MNNIIPSQDNVQTRLEMIDQLKSFLVTAPNGQNEAINQHHLPNGEIVSCVRWNDSFFISGTDIVRCLVFRFLAFGRPVENVKKFEEGIFSDLRNLKPGTDAILEEPKSPFLDLLFRNNCIRTQKKQKVFYWFSVPHDRLFLDALERDLKREKMGVEPTSTAVAHPAIAISLDTTQAMFDEFRKAMLCELNLDSFYQQQQQQQQQQQDESDINEESTSPIDEHVSDSPNDNTDIQKASCTIFGQFSLFEGSPTYKQRKRRANQTTTTITTTATPSVTTATKKRSSTTSASLISGSQYDDYKPKSEEESTRHFDCPLPSCGKIFKRLEHMKRHLRTHTLERPYLCDLCGKRFSRSDNLAQHKKTHERARPQQADQTQRRRRDIDKGLTKAYSRTSINNSRSVTTRNTSLHHHQMFNTRRTSLRRLDIKPNELFTTEPTLSNSASSTTSSCHSSPLFDAAKLPTIKLEQNELFYPPPIDTNMMIVEELLPQKGDCQTDLDDDWQRKIDWNQYSAPPSPAVDPIEDLIYQPFVTDDFYLDPQNYYYYCASSCLASPTTDFLITPAQSGVTTATNSPMIRLDDLPLYYSDESPTMTPTDALLQQH